MSKQPKETPPTDLRTFRQAAIHNRQLAEQMLTQCPGLLQEQDGVGETALHYCAIEGSREAVVWLISKGASVNTCTNSKSTPLIHAALFGQFEICKILVNAGADLMATEAIESDTALHAAARHGHLEVAYFLKLVRWLMRQMTRDNILGTSLYHGNVNRFASCSKIMAEARATNTSRLDAA